VRRPDDRHQRGQRRASGRAGRAPLPVPAGSRRRPGGRPPMGELTGQVALITGAAHGQGRATALALVKEGAHVAAFDLARPLAYPGYAMGTTADLDDLAAECRK